MVQVEFKYIKKYKEKNVTFHKQEYLIFFMWIYATMLCKSARLKGKSRLQIQLQL